MKNEIRAEVLKLKHSTMNRMIWAGPLVTVLLGYLITQGGIFAMQFTYNIWYCFLYPCLLPLLCAMNIRRERRMHYQPLLTTPKFGEGQWAAKCIAVGRQLLLMQVVFLTILTLVGFIFGNPVGIGAGMAGVLLIWAAALWQVPLYLMAASKMGMILTVIIGFLVSSVMGILTAERALFFLNPFSIGMRLMCPVLHIRPNGLLLDKGDSLLGYGVLPAGLGAALLCLAAVGWVSMKWWKRREAA